MSDPIISFPMFGSDFSLNPPRSISVLGFDIYWYGIIIALGFVLAVIYVVSRAKDFDLTEDNILDISQQVGFENLSHFNRQFKNKYHKTPKEYRVN